MYVTTQILQEESIAYLLTSKLMLANQKPEEMQKWHINGIGSITTKMIVARLKGESCVGLSIKLSFFRMLHLKECLSV